MLQEAKKTEGMQQAIDTHSETMRNEINLSFSTRNEQIFESAQWGGKQGNIDLDSMQLAHSYISGTSKEKEIAARLTHGMYLSLLGLYLEAEYYAPSKPMYLEIVPKLTGFLSTYKLVSKSGIGLVLRVIGEDLRDGEDPALSQTGQTLLQKLLTS